jgi:hypothetical protein
MTDQEQEVIELAKRWRLAVLAEKAAHVLYVEGPGLPCFDKRRKLAGEKLQAAFLRAEKEREELEAALMNAVSSLTSHEDERIELEPEDVER